MFKTTISVKTGDITKVRADALVTAANNQLRGGGGVDGAIHSAAGPTVLAACQSLPILDHPEFRVEGVRCETGNAVATTPGNLRSKVIIHAVGPRYGKDPARAAELLASAYVRSLAVAKEQGCRTVAFPCISTGIYGFPQAEAAQVAFKAVTGVLEVDGDSFDEVTFVCFQQSDLNHYLEIIQQYNHPLREYADENGKIKIIRCVNDDMSSQRGFVYPTSGLVVCPDWKPKATCGNGLHGWVWEKHTKMGGAPRYVKKDGRWLAIECDLKDVVELEGEKVKFKQGIVLFSGDFEGAAKAVQRSQQVGGFFATLTGGENSTLTGGENSTLTGGNYSTLTGGENSTLTGGNYSTLTGGYKSTLTGGNYSTLTGGENSTLTGGENSTLTGGENSTLTGGYKSTLTGGESGLACAGHLGVVSGGYGTALVLFGWSKETKKKVKRWRAYTAVVGYTNGIKPNTPYKLVDGKFVEVAAA